MTMMRPARFNWKYAIFAVVLIILLIPAYLLVSKRPLKNYPDPREPFYLGNFARNQEKFDGKMRIVTWNLHFSEKLEEIISTLENTGELQDAEVLLLQEMNIEGAETLARRLKYNYIYYPAAVHHQRKEGYGNAIFSKYELRQPTKIVLPNWLPDWLQSRNAARALITFGETEVLVYSVHLDTVWMVPFWAKSQGEFLAGEIAGQKNNIILGGDFNTWSPGSIAALENSLEKVDLERLTKGTGYTFVYSKLKLTLDHIFAEDHLDYKAGVYRETSASDHFPVWVEFTFD